MASEKDALCDKLCSMMREKRSKCRDIMTFCLFFGLAEGVIDNAAHGDAPAEHDRADVAVGEDERAGHHMPPVASSSAMRSAMATSRSPRSACSFVQRALPTGSQSTSSGGP